MLLNKRPILKILCAVMTLVGTAMLIPTAVALYYKETKAVLSLLVCSVPMIIIGLLVIKLTPKEDNTVLRMRDGFFIVAAAWIAMSALGGLPFVISGSIPNFFDAFFETASGFTTTGSTILTDIEAMPKGMLFWRSFTHWLGGMGVLVLTIALLPMLGIGGQKIMRAETTGPTMDKISFTTNESARNLYLIYTGMTVIEIVLLMFGGIGFFDAATHAFGTLGTGGLSTHSASVGYFNSVYVDMVITLFMLLAGVNFNLYYFLLSGKPRNMFKDPELRTYLCIVGGCTLFIAGMLYFKNFYGTIGESLRYSVFQTTSIITTTGYGTADFDLWPVTCKVILFVLMLVGGCASSTGGGVKVIRVILTAKLIKRAADRRLHRKALTPIKVGGKTVSEHTLFGVTVFMALFAITIIGGTLLVSLDGFGLTTSLSSVVACLCNIGPGFELVGPTMNYALFSVPVKILLSLLMIAGRLELYTIILMFTPVFWDENR